MMQVVKNRRCKKEFRLILTGMEILIITVIERTEFTSQLILRNPLKL
jgi:hypothetical protein